MIMCREEDYAKTVQYIHGWKFVSQTLKRPIPNGFYWMGTTNDLLVLHQVKTFDCMNPHTLINLFLKERKFHIPSGNGNIFYVPEIQNKLEGVMSFVSDGKLWTVQPNSNTSIYYSSFFDYIDNKITIQNIHSISLNATKAVYKVKYIKGKSVPFLRKEEKFQPENWLGFIFLWFFPKKVRCCLLNFVDERLFWLWKFYIHKTLPIDQTLLWAGMGSVWGNYVLLILRSSSSNINMFEFVPFNNIGTILNQFFTTRTEGEELMGIKRIKQGYPTGWYDSRSSRWVGMRKKPLTHTRSEDILNLRAVPHRSGTTRIGSSSGKVRVPVDVRSSCPTESGEDDS